MIGVLVSGGKDSTVCLSMAVEKYGSANVIGIFCDTGWEHSSTYEYLDYLACTLKCSIVKVKGEYGLIDLILKWKKFPSINARFCTGYLKTRPMVEFVCSRNDISELWVGIRRAESRPRSTKYKVPPLSMFDWLKRNSLKKGQRERARQIRMCFPVLHYTEPQVFSYLHRKGIQPHPLYAKGFTRVGCFPCILGRLKEFENCWKDAEGKRNIKLLAQIERELRKQGYNARLKDWMTAQELLDYLEGKQCLPLFK